VVRVLVLRERKHMTWTSVMFIWLYVCGAWLAHEMNKQVSLNRLKVPRETMTGRIMVVIWPIVATFCILFLLVQGIVRRT